MTEEALIENDIVKLVNYSRKDDQDFYECWLDTDTQKAIIMFFSKLW